MFIAYLIVTVLTAGANIFSATLDFIHYRQVRLSMAKAGVPESWMSLLGILKAVAALGLLVGIGIPLIGAAAGLGLICFFIGALIIHLRAHDYSLGLPAFFLVLAAAALALRAETSSDVASALILRFR
jgi:hypothetical protein